MNDCKTVLKQNMGKHEVPVSLNQIDGRNCTKMYMQWTLERCGSKTKAASY